MDRRRTLVAILGMHRSGTSCVTNALRHAGLFLGSQVTMPQENPGDRSLLRSVHNMDGYYEAAEAVAINDQILERSGGNWDRPPAKLAVDPADDARIVEFLDTLRTHRVAGWKDPRTVLTFARWLPHMDDCRIVACLRHPLNVARSLQVRQGMPLERGLQLWTAYNERLLDHLNSHPESMVIDFDVAPDALNDHLVAVAEWLELPRPWAAVQSFNRFLRHHTATQPLADRHIQSLYETLAARAVDAIAPRSNKKFFQQITTKTSIPQSQASWRHGTMKSRCFSLTVVSDGKGLLTVTGPAQQSFDDTAADVSSAQTVETLAEATAILRRETAQLGRVCNMQNEFMQQLWDVRAQMHALASADQVTKLREMLLDDIRQNCGIRGLVGIITRRSASILSQMRAWF